MWARDLGQRENTGFLTTCMTYETDPSKGQGNARSSRDGTHDRLPRTRTWAHLLSAHLLRRWFGRLRRLP
jgi:hypothetical protein